MAESTGAQDQQPSELSARYAPNQPYFRGVTDHGPRHQSTKYAGGEDVRVSQLRPPPEGHFIPPELACPNLFSTIGKEHFDTSFDGVYWSYGMRRQAQQILPYLYLGPVGAARDENFLRQEGITMLLGVRPKHPSFAIIVNADKAARSLGIAAEYINVDTAAEMTQMLPMILRGINDHVCRCPQHGGHSGPQLKKVLVFCETGNERSFLLVTAYVMAILNMDMGSAVYNVQSRRLCVNFDISQSETLATWEGLFRAQRDVASAQQQVIAQQTLQLPSHPFPSRKRSLADMSESDPQTAVAQEMAMGEGPFQARMAPFTDRNPC